MGLSWSKNLLKSPPAAPLPRGCVSETRRNGSNGFRSRAPRQAGFSVFQHVTLLCALCAKSLLADGGTLILHQDAGPISISVFSSPEPLRIGRGDLSVMVQTAANHVSVLDAKVKMHLSHSGGEGISEVFVTATHEEATNKLLYASSVDIPAEGVWKLAVTVDSKFGNAELAGNITVLPRQAAVAAYWPYFTVVPLIAVLFIINRRLRQKQLSARYPRARA